MITRQTIFVVDDDANIRESLRLILGLYYDVSVADGGISALKFLEASKGNLNNLPDLILLDVLMPGMDGIGLLERLNELHPQIPVIMLTASNSVKNVVAAMKIGAIDYISKPYDVDELLQIVAKYIRTELSTPNTKERVSKSTNQRRNRLASFASNMEDVDELEADFSCLVGRTSIMQELYKKIELVALRDVTVLITGESGCGKELVAKAIHKSSPRANENFVALNCAAIPETLVESELFGHEKGAFTYALEKRLGYFELADKGTLFLDEIGELSLPVQVKILRFLQQHEFHRVGKSQSIKVNVRIVTATNKRLDKLVEKGDFREDLYYRINVVSIEIPPLRERKEDIPLLINFFIRRFTRIYGYGPVEVPKETLDALINYNWPGNVREFENVIESSLALSNKGKILVSDLPDRIKNTPDAGMSPSVQTPLSFEEAGRAFETDMILKALKNFNYVKTKTAESLGISRRILKYKMDKLGIPDKP